MRGGEGSREHGLLVSCGGLLLELGKTLKCLWALAQFRLERVGLWSPPAHLIPLPLQAGSMCARACISVHSAEGCKHPRLSAGCGGHRGKGWWVDQAGWGGGKRWCLPGSMSSPRGLFARVILSTDSLERLFLALFLSVANIWCS